jgi:hypothetical protein
MTVRLRDGSTVEDPRLGRLPEFDERSRAYPIRAALTPDQQQPSTQHWAIPAREPVLDQGSDGACVGFGVTNELRFTPVPIPGLGATFAKETLYWGAQRDDQWPGGSYPGATPQYGGTSVLAGIKQGVKLGYYGEYRWAFGEADLALAVSHIGPAVIGVNWYNDMFHPDSNGMLSVSGGIAGGHCVLVCGIAVTGGFYTIYNSWGPKWGRRGTARIRRADMGRLLHEGGDAAIITVRLNPTR